MMKVFCDADGVLLDFDGYFAATHGVMPSDVEKQEGPDVMWQMVAQIPDFWASLPLMPGAMELWHTLLPYNPIVLTGCPPDYFYVAARGKRLSIAKHFGPRVPVITCHAKDKALHMMNPGDILIDDFISNVRRWTKAGGTAIYFKSAAQAIAKFNKIIEERAG